MLSKSEHLTIQDGASAWGILNFLVLNRSHLEVYLLHSNDAELAKNIKNFLKTVEKNIANIRQLLTNNNIDYPISYPSRNLDLKYNLNDATKYDDIEIAYMLLEIKRSALPIFSGVLSNSYSLDVIDKVSGYYNEFLTNLKDILKLIDKKGWMRSTPMLPTLDETKH